MWHFWVTLTYCCPKGHGNRVHRIYYEESQENVQAKILKDDLVCYLCRSSRVSWQNVSHLPLEIHSRAISELQFKKLDVSIGADFSPERL